VPQDTALPIEQPRETTLAPDLTLRQAEGDEGIGLASPALVSIGRALTQTPENDQRTNALENGLSKTEATELRQSLQRAQDKITTLENELALSRQQDDQRSRRQARRIHQRRSRIPERQGFLNFQLRPKSRGVAPRECVDKVTGEAWIGLLSRRQQREHDIYSWNRQLVGQCRWHCSPLQPTSYR
jgi:hypothetical protein